MRSVRLAVVLDCCCVLMFVVIGRASHTKGESLAGIASTAWPFLAGLAAGWIAARTWRRPLLLWPGGGGAWLGAVGPGMAPRGGAGAGTPFSVLVDPVVFPRVFPACCRGPGPPA